MGRARSLKRRVMRVFPALGLLALTGYFIAETVTGDRGLQAIEQREGKLKQAQQVLAETQADLDTWNRKVDSLRLSHLDADALDACARGALSYGKAEDIVVILSPKRSPC